jgi:RHS repeat-associated protein
LDEVIAVGGFPLDWELDPEGYVLRSSPLEAGSYQLVVGTDPLDLVGNGLVQTFELTVEVAATSPAKTHYSAPLPGLVASSTVASPLGWHGFALDEESGFYHVRHRYYDPELGRFTTTDPLGFVDGPNPYQFAHNSPLTLDDPTGQIVVAPLVVFAAEAALAGLTVYLVGESALDRMDQDSDRTLGQSLFLTTGQALALGIADNVGITGVFEAGSGVEVITGRELAGWERVGRGSEGLLGLVTSFKVGGARKGKGPKASERQAARAESEVSKVLDDADNCVLSCFVPGTLVATEDGARPIEELEIGDKVWALNLETQQNELAEVVRLFERQAPDTWILTVDGGKEIETTDEHPFFVEGKGFTRADQLQAGDRLRTFEGEWIRIEAVASRPDPRPVHNFEVADQHNYYVGTEQILVHNCAAKTKKKKAKEKPEDVPYTGAMFAGVYNDQGQNIALHEWQEDIMEIKELISQYLWGTSAQAKQAAFQGLLARNWHELTIRDRPYYGWTSVDIVPRGSATRETTKMRFLYKKDKKRGLKLTIGNTHVGS